MAFCVMLCSRRYPHDTPPPPPPIPLAAIVFSRALLSILSTARLTLFAEAAKQFTVQRYSQLYT